MRYIAAEDVAKAKEMDLLTYLRNYEPQELVHVSGNTYCTREHDSLRISNGKWCWFSQGIGGRSALDYLIKVKGIPFTQAAEIILGREAEKPPVFYRQKERKHTELLMPELSETTEQVEKYLYISPKKTTSADGGDGMKMIDDVIIIGIDSGYGNIKTANCCFPASVSAYDKEPVFKENLLVFESKFYLIGEGHKEFLADKTKDLDYYVLALAAIARELNIRKMTCGKIRIAAGLPLTWVSGQRDEFRDYLMQNKAVDFSFRNVSYHVEIVGVDVFPQGFAAVADRLSDFRGVNMICDIGNGTMNIMFINDKKPVSGNMFTEKYGTHQCLLAVRENVMRAYHTTVDEAIINRVFRFGTADIKEDYLKTITDTATDYVEGIFQRLREHEYNPELMRLYVLGGGSCLIRNFGVYDASRVTINDDICATAKGYEYLAELNARKGNSR